jgi:hypothetical protein
LAAKPLPAQDDDEDSDTSQSFPETGMGTPIEESFGSPVTALAHPQPLMTPSLVSSLLPFIQVVTSPISSSPYEEEEEELEDEDDEGKLEFGTSPPLSPSALSSSQLLISGSNNLLEGVDIENPQKATGSDFNVRRRASNNNNVNCWLWNFKRNCALGSSCKVD